MLCMLQKIGKIQCYVLNKNTLGVKKCKANIVNESVTIKGSQVTKLIMVVKNIL